MSILYLDCFSGIAGDMLIGALIHAGADPVKMEKELKKLRIEEEYQLKWDKVIKNGIASIKFDVILTENAGHSHEHQPSQPRQNDEHTQSHEHEHTHSHEDGHTHSHDNDGHSNAHDHEHIHSHVHSHDNKHGHDHHHHHHRYGQRTYMEIVQMIDQAGFSESVRDTALNIFRKIGEAEAKIHGIPLEKVHFHEVGAVDSIIDIVGAALLMDQLNVTTVKSSPVPVGTGKIKIDHGIYPVPAPATLEILKGVPILESDIRGELTTPTGAGIISVLAEEYCSFPAMKVQYIGYGAGTKTFKKHPNVLRIIIGE